MSNLISDSKFFAELFSNTSVSILVAGLSFVAGQLWSRLRYRMQFGYLAELIPSDGKINIILPRLEMKEWKVPGQEKLAIQPLNVPVMPMAEGGAIARLASALARQNRKCQMEFSVAEMNRESRSVISIGGPSVNYMSKQIIKDYFPKFTLVYPEHEAHYGSMRFLPSRDSDSNILDDYGFIFVIRRDGHITIVLCGVWGTGTDIAVKALIDIGKNRAALKLLRSGNNCFFVAHGNVVGYTTEDVEIIQFVRV